MGSPVWRYMCTSKFQKSDWDWQPGTAIKKRAPMIHWLKIFSDFTKYSVVIVDGK